jgi:hypothetical protein
MVGRNRGTKVTVFLTSRVVVLTPPGRRWEQKISVEHQAGTHPNPAPGEAGLGDW